MFILFFLLVEVVNPLCNYICKYTPKVCETANFGSPLYFNLTLLFAHLTAIKRHHHDFYIFLLSLSMLFLEGWSIRMASYLADKRGKK